MRGIGCGALFGVWDASPASAAAYAVTARGAARAAEKLSNTMTTNPDGKPYAHNAEQAEAAKIQAISAAAAREAVPDALGDEVGLRCAHATIDNQTRVIKSLKDRVRKMEIQLAQCRADKAALKRELLGEEPRGDFPNRHPTEYDSP